MNDAQMAGAGAVGFCDPEIQTIGVAGSQPGDSMQDTFLHEVFHAIAHVMDLKETESEENYVRRLATRVVHGMEQQSCCVQVVEWVDLVVT